MIQLLGVGSPSGISEEDLIFNEIPVGPIDSSNRVFSLSQVPKSKDKCLLFRNGVLAHEGSIHDYYLTSNFINFLESSIPQINDSIIVTYLKG